VRNDQSPPVPTLWGDHPAPFAIPVGPFVLHAPIGRGGMGEVWQGTHTEQGTPVAVKVMTADQFRFRAKRDAFHNEVRSVARLDHPGIVLVLDHGAISADASEASQGRLEKGSPYLVMELATGGTLHGAVVTRWGQLEAICLRMLDALAHAHARGVIHRDIKPANVLLPGPTDSAPGIKLTDFGTAHAVDQGARTGLREELAGTVQYMPPEQLAGRWRDYGPWTDLYAVGCLAWRLVTGSLPFVEPDIESMIEAHFFREPPPFLPRFPVPDGLEDWLLRLLEKEPQRRFQRAAIAAWDLRGLGEPVDDGTIPSVAAALADDAASAVNELTGIGATWQPSTVTLHAASDFEPPRVEGALVATPDSPPPLPRSWRRPPAPGRAMHVVGAGLSLYGLRSVPLVGRSAERDRLWWTLGQMRRDGTARLILLDGGAGLGKSRLIEWIGERAHELGTVTVLKATHSDIPGPGDGLTAMLGRALGTTGLDRIETAERIRGLLQRHGEEDPDEVAALTELVAPRTERERADGAPGIALTSARERHVLIRRALEREARNLPVILFLDDLHWGQSALEFAAHLLDRQRVDPSRILMLGTLRGDLLEPASVTATLVDRVLRHVNAERLPIAPLDEEEGKELVERLLHLAGPLADQVAGRAAGNPLFAVHLVGDWVQRGVLSAGTEGFELAEGEEGRVPDDIHAVWMGPVERLLGRGDEDDRLALELAAALGRYVDHHEWRTVCHLASVSPREDLSFDLLDAGLARGNELRWSFSHGLLRDSIERGARDAERWTMANLQCARMLRAAGAGTIRIASHLLAAGAEESIDLLLEGALADAGAGALAPALRALDQRERALNRSQLDASDSRWGWGWIATADLYRRLGRLEEAEAVIDRTLAAATEHGWTASLRVRALSTRATSLWDRGHARQAAVHAEEAESLASQTGGREAIAHARLVLARCLTASGDSAYAEALVRTAGADFAALERPLAKAECDFALFNLLKQSGRFVEAGELLKELTAFHEGRGRRQDQALCLGALGELERLKGNLRKAESCYRAAALIYTSTGSSESLGVDFNMALVQLGRRRYAEARDRIRKTLARSDVDGRRRFAPGYQVALAACAAAERDWRAYDRHLRTAQELQEADGRVDIDVAGTARLAGDLAFARHRIQRARDAWGFALRQWRALDRADEMLAVERLLALHAG
jgi:eukaryotic-like serine/threonine-protein kinase